MDDKLEKARRLMEQLKSKAKDIRDEVRNEDLQARKKVKDEVSLWLDQVSRIEEEAESIEAEAEKVGIFGRETIRVKLEGMVNRIEGLLKQGEFPRGVVLDNLNPPPLVTEKMEGSTPSRVQDQVWSCFEGGKTRVGVYGMGGVGKTTMAMHINNKCLKLNPLFDTVYYVTVSRGTSVSKLQHDVANALRIRFEYEDEPKRAAELSYALKQRHKCLLILDDVWEDISMVKVGVSAEGGGCKLLITTRRLDVIRRMNCVAFKLEPLTEDESWDLFVKKLGDYEALSEEAKHTARLVAEECGGLPLAIITVAGAMREERCEHVWSDALGMLRRIESSSQIDMEDEVYRILRFSYEWLKDDRHRKCFLHCALYPEDYDIEREELISMLIAVGLVDGGNNRRENLDKGHTMLNHLVNASLLEHTTDWRDRRSVKMHDLVRDMALKEIGARGMVMARNSLGEVPPETEWNNQNLELVSLMHNDIKDFGGVESPDCPNVSVLLLQGNYSLSFIPGSFFVQMIGLKVLNLSSTMIEELPYSVSGLVNLNSLLLSDCVRLRFIPSLAKLTSLREIDIGACWKMKKFPDGMEELVSLEYLSLEGSGIKGVRSGTFRKLGNLQVLLSNVWENVPPEELMSLKHLERLNRCHFDDVCGFNQCVEVGCFGSNQHPRLTDYFVTVGFFVDADEVEQHRHDYRSVKRAICVNRFSRSIGTECGLLLPCSAEFIQFSNCSFGDRSLLDAVPLLCHVTKLKTCELRSCEGVEYIIPLPDGWSIRPFLESIHELRLIILNDFGGLIRRRGVRDHGYNISFSGLRRLVIYGCPKVERLWLTNLDLPNLEELNIQDCEKMEEIFATVKGEPITLPKLLNLELAYLPELRSLWCDNDVSFPNLAKIVLRSCGELRELGCTSFNMPSLERIVIQSCKHMKEIFTAQDETGDDTTVEMPNLKDIVLGSVPELRSICRSTMVCNSLQLLKVCLLPDDELKLESCPISVPRLLEVNNSNDSPPRLEAWGYEEHISDDWWESLHWNDPATKDRLHQLGCFSVSLHKRYGL